MIGIVRSSDNEFFRAKAFTNKVWRNYWRLQWFEETAKECCRVTGCDFVNVSTSFLPNNIAKRFYATGKYGFNQFVMNALADYDREYGKKSAMLDAAGGGK